MFLATVYLLVGLVVLTAGAEFLVRGASRLAAALGVSPLVVGLTVVALGTSAPELAVSLTAALKGSTDIALGSVSSLLELRRLAAAPESVVISYQSLLYGDRITDAWSLSGTGCLRPLPADCIDIPLK